MKIYYLSLAIFLGWGMSVASWWLVVITPNAYAQTPVIQLELNPVMRHYDNGQQICTSIYAVTNQSPNVANYAHLFYDESGGSSIHILTATLPPLSTITYDLANISALPSGYRGRVVITSDNLFTATLNSCSPPTPPSNLTANPVSATQINLLWQDNSNNEIGFKIERSPNEISWTQIATIGAGINTYANIGLTSGTTYFYRVRAYTPAGDSAYSNTTSATTINPQADTFIYLPIIVVPEPPQPGEWAGKTSQGEDIFFNVANNKITYLEFIARVNGCRFEYFNNTLTQNFSGSAFSFSEQDEYYAYTISGTFTSNTRASGTLRVTLPDCVTNANITWNATKQ